MLLAFDIGNTTIAAAVFEGEQQRALLVIPHIGHAVEEIGRTIAPQLVRQGIAAKSIGAAAISSVVPRLTSLVASFCTEELHLTPLIINGGLNIGMTLRYDDPLALGSDRICSAVAGFEKFGGPLIIVDFGTATTFSVVDAQGNFLGGAISLGIGTAAEALTGRTAQLPPIRLELTSKTICTNTDEAIRAGILYGALDAAEGMMRRIRSELGTHAKVVATGGLAPWAAQHTTMIDAVEPHLVLAGVRLIYERVTTAQAAR
jgi:type III pantothenate kinase